jgi:hypothetical protein
VVRAGGGMMAIIVDANSSCNFLIIFFDFF